MIHVLGRLLLHYYLMTVLLNSIEIAESFDLLRTQFKPINFTKQLQPATKCAEGKIVSYEYELDPKAVNFVEGMQCFCQVIIFHKRILDPDQGRDVNLKLYDVIARPAYVPLGHFQRVTPFCVTGRRSTVCYCSGNGCFWDAWSVVDFLLQTYRFNTASEAEKLGNYRFDDYLDDKNFRINALQSVLNGLRKSFHFENLLPEIPSLLGSALGSVDAMVEKWKQFDKEKKKLFKVARKSAGKSGSGDDADDDDEEEGEEGSEEKQKKRGKTAAFEDQSKRVKNGDEYESGEKAKKKTTRLRYVKIFMGGLNAFSFLLILIFFAWYKSSSKKGGSGQIAGEKENDEDETENKKNDSENKKNDSESKKIDSENKENDSESKKTPAVTPQNGTPAAPAPAPAPGPGPAPAPPNAPDGAAPSPGPDAAPPPNAKDAPPKPGAPALPEYPLGAERPEFPQTY